MHIMQFRMQARRCLRENHARHTQEKEIPVIEFDKTIVWKIQMEILHELCVIIVTDKDSRYHHRSRKCATCFG